ncbi:MAG: GNAT family N-acetyltransferase [Pseudomonadota bacterium]
MVQIRALAQENQSQWRPLYEGYLIFYETPVEEKQIASVWRRLMDENVAIHGLGAFDDDGTLLGLTHYLFHLNVKFEEPVCYLQDLFTVPQSRGKGVGRALIEHVHAIAKEQGSNMTYWLTQEFNYPGRMLYDKVADRTPFIRYNKMD